MHPPSPWPPPQNTLHLSLKNYPLPSTKKAKLDRILCIFTHVWHQKNHNRDKNKIKPKTDNLRLLWCKIFDPKDELFLHLGRFRMRLGRSHFFPKIRGPPFTLHGVQSFGKKHTDFWSNPSQLHAFFTQTHIKTLQYKLFFPFAVKFGSRSGQKVRFFRKKQNFQLCSLTLPVVSQKCFFFLVNVVKQILCSL